MRVNDVRMVSHLIRRAVLAGFSRYARGGRIEPVSSRRHMRPPTGSRWWFTGGSEQQDPSLTKTACGYRYED